MTTFVDTALDEEFYKTYLNILVLQHCRNIRSKVPLLRDYDFLRSVDKCMCKSFIDREYTLRQFLIGQTDVTYKTLDDNCKFAAVFIFAELYSTLNNTIVRLVDEFVKPEPLPVIVGTNNTAVGYVSGDPIKVIFTSQ